jgi:hypothetical protein
MGWESAFGSVDTEKIATNTRRLHCPPCRQMSRRLFSIIRKLLKLPQTSEPAPLPMTTTTRHGAIAPLGRRSVLRRGSARRPGGPRHGLPPKSSGSRAGRQGLSRCSVWTPQVAGWLSSPPPALPTGEGTSRFLKGCFQLIGTTGAGKDAPCRTGLFEYGRRLLKRGPTQAIAARLGRLSHGGIVMCRLTHG